MTTRQLMLCPRCRFMLGAHYAWLANGGVAQMDCQCPGCGAQLAIDFDNWTVKDKEPQPTKEQLTLDW